jgi:hypothetical protein
VRRGEFGYIVMGLTVLPILKERFYNLKTPNGTVKEWIDFLHNLWTTFKGLIVLCGRDSILLFMCLILTVLQMPIALLIAAKMPFAGVAMDQDDKSLFYAYIIEMLVLSFILGAVNFVKNRFKESFFGRLLQHVQIGAVKAFMYMQVNYQLAVLLKLLIT